MSFQAVGPEDPKERGPNLAVQDRGTSSLFASAELDNKEPRSVTCRSATSNQVPDSLLKLADCQLSCCTKHAKRKRSKTSCAGGCHNMPRPCDLDLLTLKVVSYSHVCRGLPLCQF